MEQFYYKEIRTLNEEQHTNGGSRPIPDPTVLTTEQIAREVQGLKELLFTLIHGIDDKISTRLDGMDRALELIQAKADKVPSEVDLKTGGLKDLLFEKFDGVQTQFSERDTRTAETASLNKLAIDAALQAQKEAAGKTEEAFTRSIDKLDELINTKTGALGTETRANLSALAASVAANKERLDRLEGQGGAMGINSQLAALAATTATSTGSSQGSIATWGIVFGGAGLFVAVILGLIGFLIGGG